MTLKREKYKTLSRFDRLTAVKSTFDQFVEYASLLYLCTVQ